MFVSSSAIIPILTEWFWLWLGLAWLDLAWHAMAAGHMKGGEAPSGTNHLIKLLI